MSYSITNQNPLNLVFSPFPHDSEVIKHCSFVAEPFGSNAGCFRRETMTRSCLTWYTHMPRIMTPDNSLAQICSFEICTQHLCTVKYSVMKCGT